MIVWLLGCTSPPSVPEAVEGARARVEASGWSDAIGPFSVLRAEGAPREGERDHQILADATLAWFDMADRTVTITDAALNGPRWRGAEDPEAEQLVRTCPDRMLGAWTLEELIVHELGHGALLPSDLGPRLTRIQNWGALAGWQQHHHLGHWQDVTGMQGTGLLHEGPAVAIRLCRGEPRGEGVYRTSDEGFVSDYAKMDPLEDMAEAFRLFHRDPAALAERSPARYLALATPSAWGGRHVPIQLVPQAIVPGFSRLLETAPLLAAEVVRAHGEALQPQIDALARAPYTGPETSEAAGMVLTLGELSFGPTDAVIEAAAAERVRYQKSVDDFQAGIDKFRAKSTPEPKPEEPPPE